MSEQQSAIEKCIEYMSDPTIIRTYERYMTCKGIADAAERELAELRARVDKSCATCKHLHKGQQYCEDNCNDGHEYWEYDYDDTKPQGEE
jgi:hypothetical protein